MKLPSTKSSETSDAHLDLRAELQRRRGHRYEVITVFTFSMKSYNAYRVVFQIGRRGTTESNT